MSTTLVQRLASLVRSKSAATFYLNGAPGSGKSHLLNKFAGQLAEEIPHSFVLGPYPVTAAEVANLGNRLVQDCQQAGFVDASPPAKPLDLASAWQWLGENAHTPSGQSFLVLIDVGKINQLNIATMVSLLSSARYLEGSWTHRDIRLFHLLAGYWDHSNLGRYFNTINTSFPYTVGHNYMVWEGPSVEEMDVLIMQARPEEARPWHGRLLAELTGSHPAVILDILNLIAPGDLTFASLLTATYQAALKGVAGKALLEVWAQLADEPRSILKNLIWRRHVSVVASGTYVEQLRVAGAVRFDTIGTRTYAGFRSWYVELLARLHVEELGIADKRFKKIQLDELLPQVSELNFQAYRLVNDIENQVRNFVAIQLCLLNKDDTPMLKGRAQKYNQEMGASEDAHQRALDWRKRSADSGLPVSLNPQLAYLSTQDLATLLGEIGAEMHSDTWQNIAKAMRDLIKVRDAVMHNQLVDDMAIQRLYDLRAGIYEALGHVG